MKNIIQVYNTEFSKNSDCGSKYHGLGDLIRGTLTLYKISNNINANLIVDLSKHKIGKFLQHKNTKFIDEINKLDNVEFYFNYNNLLAFLMSQLRKSNNVFIHTNAIYNGDYKFIKTIDNTILNEDEKLFIKSIYNPNKVLNDYIEQQLKIIPEKFNIIHFRLDDKYLLNSIDVDQNKILEIEKIFNKFHEPNDVLLTNSVYLKKYLTNKYKCFSFEDTKITHLGYANDHDDQSILESLCEFFIQTRSQKIKTYSEYHWISGFSFWASHIYDIKMINMNPKINPTNAAELHRMRKK
jgi:hypothetical protein